MNRTNISRILFCAAVIAVLFTVAATSVFAAGTPGETVYIAIDPHNGEGANFIEGVVGQPIDRGQLQVFSNGDLIIEGYYTDSSYEHYFDIDNDLITGSMELHIKWAKPCTVTLAANQEGFEDQTLTLPEGGRISRDMLEQALADMKSADGEYMAYRWCKDEACTSVWNPDTDRAADGLVLYADWGYSFESFVALISGRTFATKDGRYSVSANIWPNGRYDIGDDSGGYSLEMGKIEKVGNVYSIHPSRISGTASYTMNGSTPVSMTYTGEDFKNGTYYPCWLVYCDANGGIMSNASRIKVFDGGRATAPSKADQPYREYYTFIGWFTEKEGGSKFNFNTAIHADTRIYAHWYRDFTVTLDDNMEGGKTQQVKVEEGKELPADVLPTGAPTGYHFSAWYKDAKCTEKFTGPVTKDITLYAKWDRSEFTVCFDVQGRGTNPEPTKVLYYDPLIYVPTPSYGQYTFDGWYRNKECTWKWSYSNHTVTENITLYAKWIDPCTVTFVTTGNGPTIPAVTVKYDNKFTPPMGGADGLTLDGWYTDEACTRPWQPATDKVQGNITLYARWKGGLPASVFADGNAVTVTVLGVILVAAAIVFIVVFKKKKEKR